MVLPKRKSVGTLLRQSKTNRLARIAHDLSPKLVKLSLPRFHLKTQTALNRALESLGMTDAFGESADFSGITTEESLEIGLVEHAADFKVDEEGTVAAAATVVELVPESAPAMPLQAVEFNANRPFLFFLRDDRTGAVLFAGRLTRPTPAGG